MAKSVIKKDGGQEEFQVEKLKASIQNAAKEAGLDTAEINQLAEKVTTKVMEVINSIGDKVSSSRIREKVLETLDELDNSVSRAWKDYDKKYKS